MSGIDEWKNKKVGIAANLITYALLISLVVWMFSDNDSSPSSVKTKPTQQQIARVLGLFKSENTLVLQSVYNEGGIYNWVVGVNAPYDSQGSWKGYASAMCNTLYEVNILSKDKPANSTINHGVRVVDIGKFNSTNGNWRKSSLGSANCKTWKMNNI
jgi:hypothetical protein